MTKWTKLTEVLFFTNQLSIRVPKEESGLLERPENKFGIGVMALIMATVQSLKVTQHFTKSSEFLDKETVRTSFNLEVSLPRTLFGHHSDS
jgi:hypothetical protein